MKTPQSLHYGFIFCLTLISSSMVAMQKEQHNVSAAEQYTVTSQVNLASSFAVCKHILENCLKTNNVDVVEIDHCKANSVCISRPFLEQLTFATAGFSGAVLEGIICNALSQLKLDATQGESKRLDAINSIVDWHTLNTVLERYIYLQYRMAVIHKKELAKRESALDLSNNQLFQEKTRQLEEIASRYTHFLARFGQAEPGDLMALMNALFTPTCLKTANNKVVASTILKLYNQVAAAKADIGLFTVTNLCPVITVPHENMAIVQYRIPTEKKDVILVMKKLFCDENGYIKEINEVFNDE